MVSESPFHVWHILSMKHQFSSVVWKAGFFYFFLLRLHLTPYLKLSKWMTVYGLPREVYGIMLVLRHRNHLFFEYINVHDSLFFSCTASFFLKSFCYYRTNWYKWSLLWRQRSVSSKWGYIFFSCASLKISVARKEGGVEQVAARFTSLFTFFTGFPFFFSFLFVMFFSSS